MLGSLRGRMALATALFGLTASGGFVQPAPTVQTVAPRGAKKGLFGGIALQPVSSWRYGGPGMTAAQVKRASRKRRNVRRNRAAHKG